MSASGKKEGLTRGGAGVSGGEKGRARGAEGPFRRDGWLSASCGAACTVLKKVYICRRIREIDGARFASSAGRAHPF